MSNIPTPEIAAQPDFLTLGTVAQIFGVHLWQVRRLFVSGKLPPAPRMGLYRVVPRSYLPTVSEARRRETT